MPVADCKVDRGFSAALRRKASTRVTPARAGRDQRSRCNHAQQRAFAGPCGQRGAQHRARSEPGQRVVDESQRMRPLLDEAQARVDHRGAVPEQRGDRDRSERQQDASPRGPRIEADRQPPQADHADEGRQHDHLARQPRGAPHHRGAPGALGSAEVQERGAEAAEQHHERERECAGEECRRDRHAAERGERERDDEALRRAGERREDDDGERRIHRAGAAGWRRALELMSGRAPTASARSRRPPASAGAAGSGSPAGCSTPASARSRRARGSRSRPRTAGP